MVFSNLEILGHFACIPSKHLAPHLRHLLEEISSHVRTAGCLRDTPSASSVTAGRVSSRVSQLAIDLQFLELHCQAELLLNSQTEKVVESFPVVLGGGELTL